MTSTRWRSLSGRPWRKTDVQTCVSVSQFQNRVPGPSCGATVFVSAIRNRASGFQKGFRVRPLAQLALEMTALVDEDLPILCQHDASALERPRRRPFEVDAG